MTRISGPPASRAIEVRRQNIANTEAIGDGNPQHAASGFGYAAEQSLHSRWMVWLDPLRRTGYTLDPSPVQGALQQTSLGVVSEDDLQDALAANSGRSAR